MFLCNKNEALMLDYRILLLMIPRLNSVPNRPIKLKSLVPRFSTVFCPLVHSVFTDDLRCSILQKQASKYNTHCLKVKFKGIGLQHPVTSFLLAEVTT